MITLKSRYFFNLFCRSLQLKLHPDHTSTNPTFTSNLNLPLLLHPHSTISPTSSARALSPAGGNAPQRRADDVARQSFLSHWYHSFLNLQSLDSFSNSQSLESRQLFLESSISRQLLESSIFRVSTASRIFNLLNLDNFSNHQSLDSFSNLVSLVIVIMFNLS